MKSKYKLWIFLSFIIVFAAGVFGGILLEKYIINKKPYFATLEDMANELNLTDGQEREIREIFKNNDSKFKNLSSHFYEQLSKMRTQLKNEISNVLNENQRVKFEAMIEKHISHWKKKMKKRKERSRNHKHEKGEKK
jgi:hypothetical protein